MRNPLKEEIKNRFIDFQSTLNGNEYLREEALDAVRHNGVVHSCAVENDSFPPFFLTNGYNQHPNRKWDNTFPQFQRIKIETELLYTVYLDLERLSKEKTELTPEILKDFHQSIFSRSRYNAAGKFRTENGIENEYGSASSPAKMVPEQTEQNLIWLSERMKYIGSVTGDNFFEIFHLASEIQLRITASSPFSCGNGIIARLISDYIMYCCGMFNLIILFENRSEYINALKGSSFENSTPLADFLIESFTWTFKQIELFYELSEKSSDITKI